VTNQVITTISVGGYPIALVYNSTNDKIYCANKNSNNVTIINGATNQVITTIAVGQGPHSLIYNPINNKIYCAIGISDSVVVIDCATNQLITSIAVDNEPYAFTYNPQQNRIYVGSYEGYTVSVIRDSMLGIEERTKLDAARTMVEVYPNPAKTYFIVRLPQTAGRMTVKLYDVSGKIIKEVRVTKQEARISIEGIKPGVYFLQLNNEIINKKLIITK
jgi:YVTN family beta-propeller protein